MKHQLLYEDITQKIIGAAFEVHNFLGNGFQELIYHRALELEFKKAGLSFAREVDQEIYYKDHPHSIGKRRVDFFVESKVLVEIKAVSILDNVHEAQIINYLKAFRMPIGLLINFGGKKVEHKRRILT